MLVRLGLSSPELARQLSLCFSGPATQLVKAARLEWWNAPAQTSGDSPPASVTEAFDAELQQADDAAQAILSGATAAPTSLPLGTPALLMLLRLRAVAAGEASLIITAEAADPRASSEPLSLPIRITEGALPPEPRITAETSLFEIPVLEQLARRRS